LRLVIRWTGSSETPPTLCKVDEMRYSIIVPYHEDNRLKRLLDSIPLARSDLEVLVVDDGSNNLPASVLCSNYFYPNTLHVITLPFSSGAGHARNIGIEHSQGQWLLFADADDFFLPGTFELIDEEIKKGCDLYYFMPVSLIEEDGLMDRASPFREMCSDVKMCMQGAVNRIKVDFVVPWSKVYSAELIRKNNIRFEKIRYANDVLFSVSAALNAKSISVSDGEIYCVRETTRSLTNIVNEESFYCRFMALLRKNKIIRSFGMSSHQTPMIGLVFRSRVYGLSAFMKYIYLVFLSESPLITKIHLKRSLSRIFRN